METPYQNHINKSDFEKVYEPSEDSFLLIDALEKDLKYILNKRPTFCLEVGSGSGVVITALGMAIPSCVCYSTDINLDACKMTLSTASYNKVKMEALNMNLATLFIDNKFDIIVFNPPYVVTESEECFVPGITASWAGGNKGREVTDKLLDLIPKKLAMDGVFYLLLIKENVPSEVVDIMKKFGFEHEVVIERRVRNEHQFVYKFYRRSQFKEC